MQLWLLQRVQAGGLVYLKVLADTSSHAFHFRWYTG